MIRTMRTWLATFVFILSHTSPAAVHATHISPPGELALKYRDAAGGPMGHLPYLCSQRNWRLLCHLTLRSSLVLFSGGASDIVSEEGATESVSLGGGMRHDAVSERHEARSRTDKHTTSGGTLSRSLLQNDNSGAASHSCHSFESSRKGNAGGKCRLSQEEISAMLDDQRRVWMVDEAVVRELDNDVQLLIDCTQEGDFVFFPAGSHIRPSKRVEILWRLTLGTFSESTSATDATAYDGRERAVFTCRRNRGLFYVGYVTLLCARECVLTAFLV